MSTSPVPQYHPAPVELDDLELLLDAAVTATGVNQAGSPITLTLPADVAVEAVDAGAVELVDAEGLPLVRVSWPAGEVTALSTPQHGAFRALRVSPAAYREQHPDRTLVPVRDALTTSDLDRLTTVGPLTLLAMVGTGTSSLSPVALARVTQAAAALLPDAVVVTTPLASHGEPAVDRELRDQVVRAYAATAPIDGSAAEEVAETPPGERRDLSGYPPEIAAILDRELPPRDRQGLVVFFTGLSGSGKSTLARALVDRLLEEGTRTVTSLDGDVVRRLLSSGLGFSREDRETNIRRIGWVAAEVARHGGVAVVSPIAPFAETRQQVREMVEAAGGALFLVHVATPLAECERRDRKGLYARARAGEIPDFTGISSPYEGPQDADVRVDTTDRTVSAALDDVLVALGASGYLEPPAKPAGARENLGMTTLDSSPAVEPGGATALTASSPTPDPTLDPPLHVLYVCTANICRSPSLELMSRHAILGMEGSHVDFASAGTHGVDGHLIDDQIAALLPEDVDPTHFRSHRLTAAMLGRADLVITAQSSHRSFILDDYPELFRKVFTLGQLAVAIQALPADLSPSQLLARLGETRGSAHPELDVPDPYRQGPGAAQQCVAKLEELLKVVLPRLIYEG